MKWYAVFGLLSLLLVLTGCPQVTKNSMDEGSYDAPAWLAGKWWSIDANGKRNDGYYLEKDTKKGNIKCYELDSTGKIKYVDARQVILSTVGNKVFLSFYNSGDDMSEEGYYIYEFRKVSNTEVVLAGVKEHKIGYDAGAEEILTYLEKNKDNKDLYDASETTRYKKE